MYDTINSEFKTNAGSGTFRKGADVVSESNFATIDDIPITLKAISGYNAAQTQVLKNVAGTLQWVTE